MSSISWVIGPFSPPAAAAAVAFLVVLAGRRFKSDHIYTICSDVLISINPYKKIPLLYDLDKATGTPLAEHGETDRQAEQPGRQGGDQYRTEQGDALEAWLARTPVV